jgi:DNA-binding transcriptional regulator YiaG
MHEWSKAEIKQLRLSLGVSQEAFGAILGVTRVYVNFLEKGVKTPSKTLKLLLNYVEKDVTEKENANAKEVQPYGERKGRQKDAPHKGNI